MRNFVPSRSGTFVDRRNHGSAGDRPAARWTWDRSLDFDPVGTTPSAIGHGPIVATWSPPSAGAAGTRAPTRGRPYILRWAWGASLKKRSLTPRPRSGQ